VTYDLPQAHWFKSSRSKESTACVEIAHLTDGSVGVRDSKNQTGPALVFTPEEWDAFNTSIQHGGLDRG
jgi:hypothetical protein